MYLYSHKRSLEKKIIIRFFTNLFNHYTCFILYTILYILEDPVGQDAVSVDAIHCICQGPHGCRGIHHEGCARGRGPRGHPNRLDIPGKSPCH